MKTKDKEKDFLNGKMERNIEDSGKMVNNTESGYIKMLREKKERVNGKKEKE
jgi:hypothetical protein